MSDNSKVTILDFFKQEELTEQSCGNFKTICPDCGLQGGRTEGFILFPETNTWFCHSSNKHGGILELVALKHKIINCSDCLESGEKGRILTGELFKQTLDVLESEYPQEIYEGVLIFLKLRKWIELPGTGVLISEFANSLVERFKRSEELFLRGDIQEIVEVTKDGFRIVKPNRFITLTERYFRPWVKIWKRNGEIIEIPKSMPSQIASAVLVSPNFEDSIPHIKRLFSVPIPIIHEGKLTYPKPGYDERFQSWTNHNIPKIKEIPLEDAKKVLQKIYGEFCFQDKQDYTNAVAHLITPFLRGLFSDFSVRTPLFCWLANRERAGKDYGAAIQGLVLEGHAVEESPISSGEFKSSGTNDELRKKIVSALISGKKRLHFANNKGRLNNAVLEGILTSKTYSDRLLGKNESPTFSNELDFSLSGNLGITFTPDLANRSRFIRLFLDIEDANERSFSEPNLHKWILENRGLIISAIFSLIHNWIEKKQPKGSIPFASFPEWAEICGGIMEAAELGNPCKKDEKISMGISLDEDTDEMKGLFEFVFETQPNAWLTKQQIREIIEKEDSIMPWIDWNNKSHQIKFGQKIDKFTGRILSDIRLAVENLDVRPARRKYKFTKEKANFDKKSIFGDDFDEKLVMLGNDGNIYPLSQIPIEYNNIYRDLERGENTTKTTIITKPKSDREVQFFEAKECEGIKTECSKEEVEQFLKDDPGATHKEVYEKFGTGSIKFYGELKK
jgi:hypothetical protein